MVKINIEKEIQVCDRVIDVTDFGADPTGKLDSTEAIWEAFESAKSYQGEDVIIDFPNGTYQLQKGSAQQRVFHTSNTDSLLFPEKKIALLLEDQENIIVNGNGSLFMVHGDCMAFAIVRCKEVYLHNFSWDYSVSTVIEMTVSTIGEEEGEQYTDFTMPACLNFSIDDHGEHLTWYSDKNPQTGEYYWTDQEHKGAGTIVIYHPDQNIMKRCDFDQGPFNKTRTKIVQLNNNTIRIYYGDQRPKSHQKDVVFEYCSIPNRETAGAFIWESQHIVIDQVNVHYLHGFGWLTQMSEDVAYFNCTFKTREETGRHASSYADLIHVSGASGHVHIEDCAFHHPHDDPINIHGTFTRVEEKIDKYTLKLRYVHRQQGGFPQFYKGNQVMFYRRDTLTPALGEEKYYRVTAVKQPGEQGNDVRTMVVTFAEPLPDHLFQRMDGEPLIVAENVTYTPTVHIKNNHFETIPTRGILCSTRKRVFIENNTFKHTAMNAIFISNDSQEWYESGPVRDVTIKNNHFYMPQAGNGNQAAICILPVTKGYQFPVYEQAIHQNINIINNHFYLENELVLEANSVKELLFQDNDIDHYEPVLNQKYDHMNLGDQQDLKNMRSTFKFTACQHVTIGENQYKDIDDPVISHAQMPREEIQVKRKY